MQRRMTSAILFSAATLLVAAYYARPVLATPATGGFVGTTLAVGRFGDINVFWVEPGDVSSKEFNHASIQATIRRRFLGPLAPVLSPRVMNANDVESMLTRTSPRTGIPLKLPPEKAVVRRRPAAEPFPNASSTEFEDLLFLARMLTGFGPR